MTVKNIGERNICELCHVEGIFWRAVSKNPNVAVEVTIDYSGTSRTGKTKKKFILTIKEDKLSLQTQKVKRSFLKLWGEIEDQVVNLSDSKVHKDKNYSDEKNLLESILFSDSCSDSKYLAKTLNEMEDDDCCQIVNKRCHSKNFDWVLPLLNQEKFSYIIDRIDAHDDTLATYIHAYLLPNLEDIKAVPLYFKNNFSFLTQRFKAYLKFDMEKAITFCNSMGKLSNGAYLLSRLIVGLRAEQQALLFSQLHKLTSTTFLDHISLDEMYDVFPNAVNDVDDSNLKTSHSALELTLKPISPSAHNLCDRSLSFSDEKIKRICKRCSPEAFAKIVIVCYRYNLDQNLLSKIIMTKKIPSEVVAKIFETDLTNVMSESTAVSSSEIASDLFQSFYQYDLTVLEGQLYKLDEKYIVQVFEKMNDEQVKFLLPRCNHKAFASVLTKRFPDDIELLFKLINYDPSKPYQDQPTKFLTLKKIIKHLHNPDTLNAVINKLNFSVNDLVKLTKSLSAYTSCLLITNLELTRGAALINHEDFSVSQLVGLLEQYNMPNIALRGLITGVEEEKLEQALAGLKVEMRIKRIFMFTEPFKTRCIEAIVDKNPPNITELTFLVQKRPEAFTKLTYETQLQVCNHLIKIGKQEEVSSLLKLLTKEDHDQQSLRQLLFALPVKVLHLKDINFSTAFIEGCWQHINCEENKHEMSCFCELLDSVSKVQRRAFFDKQFLNGCESTVVQALSTINLDSALEVINEDVDDADWQQIFLKIDAQILFLIINQQDEPSDSHLSLLKRLEPAQQAKGVCEISQLDPNTVENNNLKRATKLLVRLTEQSQNSAVFTELSKQPPRIVFPIIKALPWNMAFNLCMELESKDLATFLRQTMFKMPIDGFDIVDKMLDCSLREEALSELELLYNDVLALLNKLDNTQKKTKLFACLSNETKGHVLDLMIEKNEPVGEFVKTIDENTLGEILKTLKAGCAIHSSLMSLCNQFDDKLVEKAIIYLPENYILNDKFTFSNPRKAYQYHLAYYIGYKYNPSYLGYVVNDLYYLFKASTIKDEELLDFVHQAPNQVITEVIRSALTPKKPELIEHLFRLLLPHQRFSVFCSLNADECVLALQTLQSLKRDEYLKEFRELSSSGDRPKIAADINSDWLAKREHDILVKLQERQL